MAKKEPEELPQPKWVTKKSWMKKNLQETRQMGGEGPKEEWPLERVNK